jgi:hypothetical protein
MSGALVQLVAKGAQDAYLTGRPEVSFFHQAYKRHTNFAQKQVQLTYTGTPGSSSQLSIKVPNKGDLLGYIWMDLGTSTIGTLVTGTPTIFELYIGGQLIDRQDAFFMVQFWQKFLVDSSAKGYSLLGGAQVDQDSSTKNVVNPITNLQNSTWLPLHFFFCDSCYLPLTALQYHEVEIRVTFGTSAPAKADFYANYVVLDTDERAMLVDKEIDLLIEQVQRIPAISASKFDLSYFNHPIKCLLWGNPSTSSAFETKNVQIYLNGNELFGSELPDVFFTSVSSYYHSEFASILQGGINTGTAPVIQKSGGNLKMYSFALKANKHQPCGTCNFSRLDSASLTVGTGSADLTNFNMYAVNFNVLRIKSGMGGLAFSS